MRPELARQFAPFIFAALAGAAFLALWQSLDVSEPLELNIGGCVSRCLAQHIKKSVCVAVCVFNPHAF